MVMKRLLAGATSVATAALAMVGIGDDALAEAKAKEEAHLTRAQEMVLGYYAEADLSEGFLPYRDYRAPHANRPTPRRQPRFKRPTRYQAAGSVFGVRLFKGHRP